MSNITLTSDGRIVKASKPKNSSLDSLKGLADLKTDKMKFAEKVCKAVGLEVDYNESKKMDYSVIVSKHEILDWCDIQIQISEDEAPICFYIASLDNGVSKEGGFAAEVQVEVGGVKALAYVINLLRTAKNRATSVNSVDELAKCFNDTFASKASDTVPILSNLGLASMFEIEIIDLEYALCKAANKTDLYRKYFINTVKNHIKQHKDDFRKMMQRLLEEYESNDEELDYYALVFELYDTIPVHINYDCVEPASISAKNIIDNLGITDEVDKLIEMLKKYH